MRLFSCAYLLTPLVTQPLQPRHGKELTIDRRKVGRCHSLGRPVENCGKVFATHGPQTKILSRVCHWCEKPWAIQSIQKGKEIIGDQLMDKKKDIQHEYDKSRKII